MGRTRLGKTPDLLELVAGQLSRSSLCSSGFLRSPWSLFFCLCFRLVGSSVFLSVFVLCVYWSLVYCSFPFVSIFSFFWVFLLWSSSVLFVLLGLFSFCSLPCCVRSSPVLFVLVLRIFLFVCFLLLLLCVCVPLTPRSSLPCAPSFLCVFCSRCSSVCVPPFLLVT